MSDPFALTRQDGTIHAYACGRCGQVGGGGSWCGPDPITGFCCVGPDHSREDAMRCCTCRCGVPVRETGSIDCAACHEKWQAECAAEEARAEALPPVTPPSDVVVDVFDLELFGGLKLEIRVEEDGLDFYVARCAYRNAERPEASRDFSCAGQRNANYAVTEVLNQVHFHLCADIVSLVRRPS